MPFNSNNGGGPWGGGGRGDRGKSPWSGGGGGGGKQQGPDLDDLIRKGRDQLRVVLGGKGGGPGTPGRRGPGGGGGFERYLPVAIPAVLLGAWAFTSFYSVAPEEKSVELFLGEFSEVGEPGLNFAPWPLVTYVVLPVKRENVIDIGTAPAGSGNRSEQGLMLTGDENIVDIDFQVVWNVADPAQFLFNLTDPELTIQAVAESAMREIIARSELKPILSRDRAVISQEVEALIQATLDSYDAGVNIVRVIFDRADPPREVIDAFRDVQAAEQDRVTEENRAEAYANQKLAAARGDVAQILQEAEAYRARVVNQAMGEASRFESIYAEYADAPEVTRKRLYLDAIETVLGDVNKVVIDNDASGANGGQGVVPYLPLDQLRRKDDRNDVTEPNEETQ
jgi:membrane protease subunit HflK